MDKSNVPPFMAHPVHYTTILKNEHEADLYFQNPTI